MAFPIQSADQNQLVNKVSAGGADGPWSPTNVNLNNPPSVTGLGTMENQVPNYRDAVTKRNLMTWFIPEGPMVQMYINPSAIKYNYKKLITKVKTKGGWTLQYYGEDLGALAISGSTGTSGWEGINVLHEIYRNEQYKFDATALTLQAERDKSDQESFDGLIFAADSLFGQIENTAVNLKLAQKGYYNSITQSRNKPTLASMAFTVEMMYKNLIFRGYFDSFNIDESVEHLGLFNYNMSFIVTQQRGYRYNDQYWQKSPVTGPSQSNISKPGPQRSYGAVVNSQSISQNVSKALIDAFQVY
jgi:hypothetical protein